jgi:hypothetical protein
MLIIFSTPVLIRYLWQLKAVVFLHSCRILAVLFLENAKKYQKAIKDKNLKGPAKAIKGC